MTTDLTTMTRRSVSRSLAGVLAELELRAPEVVDLQLMREAVEAAGEPGDRAHVLAVIDGLRRNGWLLPLRTRGVWEFAPAARSGAFRSGDPFTELRAYLARHPDRAATVAMESAAFRLGLASHPPSREVLAVGPEVPSDGALSGFRLVRLQLGPAAAGEYDGLACHTVEGLVVAMAAKPSGYRDWPNVGQWLADAAARVQVFEGDGSMRSLLSGRPAATWARAAYLLRVGGQRESAAELLDAGPGRPTGPVYLGPRPSTEDGRRSALWDHEMGVYDSVLRVHDTVQEPAHPRLMR